MQAFKKGFQKIMPVLCLQGFTYQEIDLLVCGESNEEWSVESLSEVILTAHGYHAKSRVFLDLLKYMCQV